MKKLITLALIALSTTAFAQTEKVKIQLKHTVAISEMFAASQDSSDGQLNTEFNYQIGGSDFQVGIAFRTDSKWENISVGVTTTTRIFQVNDQIRFSGLLGAGMLVVNQANPDIKAGYVEVGLNYQYKIGNGWVAGTFFKEWFYTKKATPVGGLTLSHTF